MGEELVVDFHWLAEVNHSILVGGVYHGGIVYAGSGFELVTARRMYAEIAAREFEVFGCFGAAGAIHGEHTPAISAAEGGVVEIVIENHNIAGIGLHGDAAGEVRGRDAEKLK